MHNRRDNKYSFQCHIILSSSSSTTSFIDHLLTLERPYNDVLIRMCFRICKAVNLSWCRLMDRLSETRIKNSKRNGRPNKYRERNLLALIKALYDDYHQLYTTNNGLHWKEKKIHNIRQSSIRIMSKPLIILQMSRHIHNTLL
jgi:hypothetical protein